MEVRGLLFISVNFSIDWACMAAQQQALWVIERPTDLSPAALLHPALLPLPLFILITLEIKLFLYA